MRLNLKKTVMNLNKFKSIDKVNAIMSLWGTSGTISSDFATKNKIVHMSCSCSDVVSDGFYNFNHSTKPMTHMKRIVEYYKKNNYKKIGLLYVSVLEVEEFMRDFKPLLEKEGFEIVFSTAIHPGEKDLKTEIMKMKDKQPDVVYLQILPPALITFAKQHKELGFNVPLTNMNVFSFAPDLYEGAIYFTESEGTSDFGKEFTGKTGLNQMSCTINMYDGLKMIVDGYEKTPLKEGEVVPSNEEVVKTMLNNKDFKSALDFIEIDEKGNIDSKSIVKQIQNGKAVTVEE